MRRTADVVCLVCTRRWPGAISPNSAGRCQCGAPAYVNAERALDSRLDLFSAAGVRKGAMPFLDMLAGPAAIDTGDPGPRAMRIVLLEPMDRITIYLLATGTPQGQTPGGKPGQMALQVRLGVECFEEPLVTFPFTPAAPNDGGHLVTFATAQLWTSIVLVGATVVSRAPVPDQKTSLVLHTHNSGMCCAQNPLFGDLVDSQGKGT